MGLCRSLSSAAVIDSSEQLKDKHSWELPNVSERTQEAPGVPLTHEVSFMLENYVSVRGELRYIDEELLAVHQDLALLQSRQMTALCLPNPFECEATERRSGLQHFSPKPCAAKVYGPSLAMVDDGTVERRRWGGLNLRMRRCTSSWQQFQRRATPLGR